MTTNLLRKAIVPLAGVAVITLVLSVVGPWALKPLNASGGSGTWNFPTTSPYQVTLGALFGTGFTTPYPNNFTVPTTIRDGRLVDYFKFKLWGACQTTGSSLAITPSITSSLNNSTSAGFPQLYANPSGPGQFYFSSPGYDYASPGTTVQFGIQATGTGSASCTGLVVGELYPFRSSVHVNPFDSEEPTALGDHAQGSEH